MLPDGWTLERLDSIATVERGRFSARPRNDPKYFGGETPFVQTGDVAGAQLYLRTHSQTLNALGLTVSKVFEEGTILLTIAANIGATAITRIPTACPDSVVGIRPLSAATDLLWLKYALASRKEDLEAQAGQNAQKNINLEVLKPLRIAKPPTKEQRRIGDTLSTWDHAIGTAEQLVSAGHRQLKALQRQLLIKPVMSGEWDLSALSEVSERIQRRANEEEVLPVLMISSGSGFVRQDEKYSRFMAGKSVENYIALDRGEFAYNKGNSKLYEFGCVFALRGYERGLVPNVYVCFKLLPSLNATFYEHLFRADYLHDQLGAIVNTGVRNNGLLNIRPADFLACRVPVPPMAAQNRIAAVLTTAARYVELRERDLDLLKREKAALMSQLLAGKRRVKVPAAETEAQA
ncbi:restriction endonuclease subunit S [Hydrogenophaga pseudoflava]|uniref:restriction endonuclease subunit S n=1 Tax=Hydrogenophaga pseudoflava TaxID=47421 RepID=UPI000A04021E|nr:restriction endonuclease subunit S [Hydrogenophaga pseudoflava]